MSFVKLAARCLMISAMPFLLSALFFRSRLRRHTVPEHAHLAESAEVVPAELYYLARPTRPEARPSIISIMMSSMR